uniref:Uncharacterized protein n=1 Tax=Anguilla anguilla TaxID=7936 RepID=A0A0E9Q9U6_ANGAN
MAIVQEQKLGLKSHLNLFSAGKTKKEDGMEKGHSQFRQPHDILDQLQAASALTLAYKHLIWFGQHGRVHCGGRSQCRVSFSPQTCHFTSFSL